MGRTAKKHQRRDVVPVDYDGTTALPNARLELFCQCYTGEYRRNAAGAYRAAGYRPKTDHAACVLAGRMLTNVDIKKRIAHLEEEVLSRIRLTAVDAQNRLGSIVSARYSDFLGEDGEVDIGKVRDPRLAPAVESCDAVYDRDGIRIGWRLRLHDPKKALELLGLTARPEDAATQQAQQVLVIKV